MTEVLERPGAQTEVLVDRDELAAFRFVRRGGTPGAGPHFHAKHVDAFVVLEGAVEILTAGASLRLEPGDAAAVPPGVVHGFDNVGPGEVRLLNLHAPSQGFAEYLRRQYAGVETDSRAFDQHPPDEAPGGEPLVSRAGEGERYDRGDRVITIRFELPQLCLVEFAFEPPFKVDPHVHDDHVDTFYVVDGEVAFTRGDETVIGRPGDFFAAPPGTRHGFRPANDRPAPVLNMHAPDSGFAGSLRP